MEVLQDIGVRLVEQLERTEIKIVSQEQIEDRKLAM